MTQTADPAVVNQPPTKPVKAGIGLRLAIDQDCIRVLTLLLLGTWLRAIPRAPLQGRA